MSTENKELDKKKRGAQPGNLNARVHGFYSRELTTEQANALEVAHGVQALDQEIALLRLKSLAIANSPNENFPALLMALSLLTKMLIVDMELKEKAAGEKRLRNYREGQEELSRMRMADKRESASELIRRFRSS